MGHSRSTLHGCHTSKGREMTQPEALRLADELERVAEYDHQVQAAAELRRLHEANQLMLNTLRWIDKLCPDEFHYFDKQKPGLQRVLAKMAYDAGGLARSTIEKVEEI